MPSSIFNSKMDNQPPTLWSQFAARASLRPNAIALETEIVQLSYGTLALLATAASAGLASSSSPCALWATRTPLCFSSLLAILRAGRAYVPLHPSAPVARTLSMLQTARVGTLVLERADLDGATPLLHELVRAQTRVVIAIADLSDVSELQAQWPSLEFMALLQHAGLHAESGISESVPGNLAYVLFTSGTTGQPKGVAVSHANVLAAIRAFQERYAFEPQDRFSQNFELTFDLSVFDMFAAWLSGATLVVPPKRVRSAPARWASERQLSVWFSTPSTVALMAGLRQVRAGLWDSVRVALVCGETCSPSSAAALRLLAPNAIVENLYGPTEATIACTAYRVTGQDRETIPIGMPLPSTRVALVDPESNAPGVSCGELWLAGSQVAQGYFHNEATTRERFVQPEWDPNTVWYRTGDLVRWNESGRGELVHLGRLDSQVKVHGHRVELGEVEAALTAITGHASACILWRGRLAAVLVSAEVDSDRLRAQLGTLLPDYMVPERIVTVDALPLTLSSKLDRAKLEHYFE
jgi:amino acid adenylation domain-containing protein